MDFVITRNDLRKGHVLDSKASPVPLELGDGDVLLKIEKFSFTANNISYAATGNALGYFNFFPIVSDVGLARIPVWGLAEGTSIQ